MSQQDVQDCIAKAFQFSAEEARQAAGNKVPGDLYVNGRLDRGNLADLMGRWLSELIQPYFNAKKLARKATGNLVWGMCFCFCTLGVWLCHLLQKRNENHAIMDEIMGSDNGASYWKRNIRLILVPMNCL
eukprot:TRINITY_DN8885_c0_g1_i1.p1 TRINITY_DN8885_c0_g1~~TRINITY_DN8885_c0_g1_i1.p1  ORF type:complete len:130 (-),score=21.44 TRINITY_DN8885_c0_g1_i1:202-591(-)